MTAAVRSEHYCRTGLRNPNVYRVIRLAPRIFYTTHRPESDDAALVAGFNGSPCPGDGLHVQQTYAQGKRWRMWVDTGYCYVDPNDLMIHSHGEQKAVLPRTEYHKLRPEQFDAATLDAYTTALAGFEPYPEEEPELLAAEDAIDSHRVMKMLEQGLSPCCEAPINYEQVATSGKHKGCGPRFCSRCRKLVFQV